MNITKYIRAAADSDQSAISYLKSIKKGIYFIVFKPSEELHNSLVGKHHQIIEKDIITLKPGKFANNLYYRLFGGSKSYNGVWVNPDGEKGWAQNVEVFLIADTSHTTNDFEEKIEISMKALAKMRFENSKLINKSKEFRVLEESDEYSIVEQKIKNIYREISDEIKHEKTSPLSRILFNL